MAGTDTATKENKLGTRPIAPLLVSMAVPMMLSFLIQALYNFVDSIFVAHISENALTAVSLAYPVQCIISAVSVGLGIGACVVISRSLGEGNKEKADNYVNTGIFMLLLVTVVITVAGTLLAKPYYTMQTNVAEIVEGGTVYMRINCLFSFGIIFGIYLEKILIGVGFSFYSMLALALGSVVNLILDPVLIFGLGPFPEMGITGAGYATVIGQMVEFAVSLFYLLWKNKWTSFSLHKIFHPSKKAAKEITVVGLPSMINVGIPSISSFLINQILLSYSTTATAAYGIWLKLQNFCYMPAYGLNNGMLPILSYNYGTGQKDRVKQTIRYAITWILVLMLALVVIFFLIPNPLLRLFDATDNMMRIAVPMLRICLISLIFGAYCIVNGSAMQALGGSNYTLVTNLMRNLVILVGAFFLLNRLTGDQTMIWLAVPIAEMITCVFSFLFFRKIRAGALL